MWFEKQELENIQSLLNHYFPKFDNSENKCLGITQNTSPFTNGYTIVDSAHTKDRQLYHQRRFNHAR